MEYEIILTWDNEACVWTATSDDIPGLILEDDSADKLIQKVLLAAPELIELNGANKKSTMHFFCDRHESVVFANG